MYNFSYIFIKLINFALYVRYFKIVLKFKKIVGYYPNISSPRKYHEMMLWRKIFDHNPLFTIFCDKITAKEYIKSRLPYVELPETLWVGDAVSDIPRELWGVDAVLKANHGSSFNYFDGINAGNIDGVSKMTSKWLRSGYGRSKCEWGYSGVPRKFFLERRVCHPGGETLLDVSVRCADGVPVLASAMTGAKTPEQRSGYFDLEGRRCHRLEGKVGGDGLLPMDFKLPASFFQAIEYAGRLSVGVDYARYDFLCVGDRIYPGEITVYPGSGMTAAADDGIDALIVEAWDIRRSWFFRTPQRGWRKMYAAVLRECRFGIGTQGTPSGRTTPETP